MKSRILTLGLAIISILTTFLISFFRPEYGYYKYNLLYILLVLSLVLCITVFVIFIIRTFKVNNKSLTIALLGFPRIGKTVFLTVLFNELQKVKSDTINFLPYGNETVEKVTRDISSLQRGEWLPKTEVNQFFYYRATTTIGNLIKRSYKLEIGDFAGERFNDLSDRQFNWLHRDVYFDYTTQSDAIFLAISAEIFNDEYERIEVINSTIASLNILSQKKGYTDSQKMKEPICLLILKSDILYEKDKGYYLDVISDLITVCNKRSMHFKSFFVSSVGETDNNNRPVANLRPQNVIEPLLWILKTNK